MLSIKLCKSWNIPLLTVRGLFKSQESTTSWRNWVLLKSQAWNSNLYRLINSSREDWAERLPALKRTSSCLQFGYWEQIQCVSDDDVEQGECLFERWFVRQSRNWEVFAADLGGQGLPSAPLQNNSTGGSWPPPRHTNNLKCTWSTLSRRRLEQGENALQSPSPDMIMQECSDGLCKQTCLGNDVRSGPGEWVVPTTAIAAEMLMLHKQFLLRHF